VLVPRDAWGIDQLPAHLRPTYRVVDEAGKEQARGKDLAALKAPLRPRFEQAMAEVAADSGVARTGEQTWAFGEIAATATWTRAGHEVRGFPALVDEGATVGMGVYGSADEADARHRLGVRRLLLLGMRNLDPLAALGNAEKLGLAGSPYPTVAELVDDLRAAVAGSVVDAHPPVRDEGAYDALAEELDGVLEERLAAVLADVLRVLEAWRQTEKRISGRAELTTLAAMQDMRAQVSRLVDRGFVGEAGPEQLRRYPVYLMAVDHRRERLDSQVAKDAQLMAQVADVQASYLNHVAALPAGRPPGAALRRVRWMLEEYRVSLWAQQLGTAYSISDQRIRRALADASTSRS
jgi:ATP-dependent helicase HrpA